MTPNEQVNALSLSSLSEGGVVVLCAVLGFRREGDENSALLGFYAATSGNFVPTFRDNLSVPSSGGLTPEDGTDRFSRNYGTKLALLAA